MTDKRGTQGGPWAVLDYDGEPLPGRWPTETLAIEEGLCGRYLLSGAEVQKVGRTRRGSEASR